MSGYVMQDDLVHAMLTVLETLRYTGTKLISFPLELIHSKYSNSPSCPSDVQCHIQSGSGEASG
jgi:hypothetical protein